MAAISGRRQAFLNDPQLQRFVIPNARPTGRQLGMGSYGSVEELEINTLRSAGKRIHEALVEFGNIGVQNLARKYVEECQLMSDLRHPHIVQFLGLCFLRDCSFPVLVMEKLLMSLDDLLENTPDIPLSLKLSMLADVASGLVYLHNRNPPVIHRDLSAKNVLLNSSMVAKISDMGNSRIVDFQPGQLARTLSRLPGTQAYMPPEAFDGTSRYGPSLDIFSFGHMTLFTLTQVFPGELLLPTYPDPQNPERLLGRTEVERRRDYIDQVHRQLGERHPLLQLMKQCLHNTLARRPSAEEVLQQLEGVRGEIRDPYQHLTKLEMMKLLREKDEEIQVQRQQLQVTNRQSESQPCARLPVGMCHAQDMYRPSLQWQPCADLPVGMHHAQVVVLEGKAYVGGGVTEEDENNICRYDFTSDLWATISSPTRESALAAYYSQLVLVGGRVASGLITSHLWALEEDGKSWSQPHPAMPTARYGASAMSIDRHLIVAGGVRSNKEGRMGSRFKMITTPVVEVYNGQQWMQIESLPRGCYHMKQAYYNDAYYLLGGRFHYDAPCDSVYCASLQSLISEATPHRHSSIDQGPIWKTLPAVDHEFGSIFTFGGILYVAGGFSYYSQNIDWTPTLQTYSPLTRSWFEVGELPVAVSSTCTVVLPTEELMMFGGYCEYTPYSVFVYKTQLKAN